MGLWDSLTMNIFDVLASSDAVVEALDKTSLVLNTAELIWDRDEISRYRSAVDRFSAGLETGQAVIKDTTAAFRLFAAARRLPTDVRANPELAAREFGLIFGSLGRLAHLMPFPFGAYFELFAGAEDFFLTIRAQMDPQVHMREPGLRQIIDNL